MALAENGLIKLLEEMGELAQVICKRLAYPEANSHPDGNPFPIAARMEQEIADVYAAIMIVIELDPRLSWNAINPRAHFKHDLYREWSLEP